MSRLLLNYTRKPINNVLYDPKLAYSMHLALQREDGSFQALNHNSGVLFAKATENRDGSLEPKSIRHPHVFQMKDGTFGIVAVRTLGEGGNDPESKGSVVVFSTEDFVDYKEWGLLLLEEEYIEYISACYDPKEDCDRLFWRNTSGVWHTSASKDIRTLVLDFEMMALDLEDDTEEYEKQREKALQSRKGFDAAAVQIEGCVPENAVSITDGQAAYLEVKLMTPVNTAITVPEQIAAGSEADMRKAFAECRAKVSYSDGTCEERRVDWEIPNPDFSQKGNLIVRGAVHQDHFAFPVAFNRADPCVAKWGDKYYFIATNDADDNHTLYIREADSIPELADAEEHLILDSSTYPEIGGLLWAPEFHEVEGRLYIFHAATTGEFFREESCIMELAKGGNPINREDWSRPRRIVRRDGSELCRAGEVITLDMTCFRWEGDYYAVWSQRQFLPKDLGAWLYIAKLDPREPWKLLTEPVVLSKPEYGWANNHTFVDEGPFALPRGDKLYLTFSSAAVDTSYVVGLLMIEKGKDLLEPKNWHKKNYPILTSRSVEGEFGTGHNAYVIDEEGLVWNTYHARPGTEGVRSSGIRRVHFDADGEPRLDVTEEIDLRDELRCVATTLQIL